jgi:hypothetical protein
MFEDKKHVQVVTKAWSDPRIITCHQTAMTLKGDMAWELIKRFGLIAGEPEGEDSSGRAVMRPMDTTEVVARACAITEATWNEFEKRGWLQALPTPPEVAE